MNPYEDVLHKSQRGQPNVAIKKAEFTPSVTPQNDYSDVAFKGPTQEEPSSFLGNIGENIAAIPGKLASLPGEWFKTHFTREGQEKLAVRNRNFGKAILSGASAGFSEYFTPLKVDRNLDNAAAGDIVGSFLPIGLTYKGIGLGARGLSKLFNIGTKFGPTGEALLGTGHEFLTGGIYGTEKELAKVAQGEEFNPWEPAKEAAMFAATGALIRNLINKSTPEKEWFRSLRPKQAEEFVSGQLPKDLPPNQFKYLIDDMYPQWMDEINKFYESELTKANEAADVQFKQNNSIAKANHERELYEINKKNEMTEAKYKESVDKYEKELQDIFDQHEANKAEIENSNQQIREEFEQAQQDYTNMRTREEAVQQATALRPDETNLPYRRSDTYIANPSLENQIGNIISRNEATNTTNAGEAVFNAIRANADVDRRIVTMAYNEGNTLARGVEQTHPILLQQLQLQEAELLRIPLLSEPQRARLNFIQANINRLRTIRTIDGNQITTLHPISNDVLHNQAREMRHQMDYTYLQGNTKGIFQPTVDLLENAQVLAAEAAGIPEAATALRDARTLHYEWSRDYNNEYINPFREVNNHDFSGKFKQITSNPDQYNAVSNILNRSNAGQQMSQVARRSAVENKLQSFLENPHGANPRDFEKAVNELYAFGVTPEQTAEIRGAFNTARRAPIITEPKAPKYQEVKEPKLPKFTKAKPTPKEPPQAPIAHRKLEETSGMKLAQQLMKKSPEDLAAMTDKVSGLKQLRETLPKESFEKIKAEKTRQILYGDEVQPNLTGTKVVARLNQADNFALMAELHGDEEALAMLEAAKKIKDSPFTKENIINKAKAAGIVRILIKYGLPIG